MARIEPRTLSLLDVTLRDGSYAIDYQFTPQHVSEIVTALDTAGVDAIEVSHGCGLGARENLKIPSAASDEAYVEAARRAAKRAKIGVIAGAAPVTLPDNIDRIIDSVDFIRFAVNCDAPGPIESNIAYSLKKRPDLQIYLQLMRSTRKSFSTLLETAKHAQNMGVHIIYLVDTAGHFLPHEVEEIVKGLTLELKIGVGFHGHNNLGLAIANTLAAVRGGAISVDASLRGMGRAAGNAQLEALASLLRRLGLAGHLNLDTLLRAGSELIEPLMPASHGIASDDVLTADANIDLYPLPFFKLLTEKAGVAFEDFVRAIGNDTTFAEVGLDEIRRAFTHLGIDPEPLFESFGLKG